MMNKILELIILVFAFQLVSCGKSSITVNFIIEGTTGNNTTLSVYTGSVNPIYPINGANWNDYIDVSDKSKDVFSQTDTACPGTRQHFLSCRHGGELKEFVVANQSSCDNLTITENLGIFNWTCRVVDGKAVFYSNMLNDEKGLKHLIDSSGWLDNFVEVHQSGSLVAKSNPSKWWSNSIVALPDNTGATALELPDTGDDTNTVYYIDADKETYGYNINGDNVSLVNLNNSKLIFNGGDSNNCDRGTGEASTPDARVLICSGNQKYLWLEMDLKGKSDSDPTYVTSALYFYEVRLSQIRNTKGELGNTGSSYYFLSFMGANGLRIHNIKANQMAGAINLNGYNNLIDKVHINNSGTYPFRVTSVGSFDTRGNIIHNVKLTNTRTKYQGSGSFDIYSDSTNLNNILNMYIFGTSYGTGFTNADAQSNTFMFITSANSSMEGFRQGDSSILNNLLTFNNGTSGLYLIDGNTDSGHINYNIASVNNDQYGIQNFNANNTEFHGAMLVGNNTWGNCDVAGGTNVSLDDSSCTTSGDGANDYLTAGSTAILRMGKDITNSVVGKVFSDSVNTDGVVLDDFDNITDWYGFENFERGWSMNGGAFPDSGQRAQCYTSAQFCQIFDYSLQSNDLFFRNKTNDGDTDNEEFVADSICPTAVSGNSVIDGYDTEIIDDGAGNEDVICDVGEICDDNIFLMNAREILKDEIGDDDGLCESNEACIYAPNFGAYQGHGDYSSQGTCLFQDGTVSGVSMYAYPINGR